jgi:hypothetical protein
LKLVTGVQIAKIKNLSIAPAGIEINRRFTDVEINVQLSIAPAGIEIEKRNL